MINLSSVVALYSDRGIVQHRQQVLFRVSYTGGILTEAVEHKADMLPVQPQQPGLHHRLGKVVPR